jgi:PEP-CTERM motif
MNFKQWAAACAVVLAGPAMAATCTKTTNWYDMGPPAFNLLGNAFGSAGGFNDCYNFTLSADALAFGGVIGLDMSRTLDINVGSVSLFSGTSLVGSGSSPLNFNFGGLSAGNYTLAVNGTVTNTSGAAASGLVGYFGTVTTHASVAAPVPEPEAYALMLAGFVGVGVGVLRRKKA